MAKNLKKYPLKRVLIYKDKKMEITLNAKETQAVIQAGLEATGMGQGLNLININVTQSRKTGNASIILEADSGFGMDEAEEPQEVQQELPLEEPEQTVTEETKVESEPVQEEVEQPEVQAEAEEPVVEEPQPEATVEDTTEDTVEDTTEDTVEDTTEDTVEDTTSKDTTDTVEDTTEDTVEDTTEDTVEDTTEDTDSLFATGSTVEEEEPKAEVESDSLFS